VLQREFTEEQDMFRDAYRKVLATGIVPQLEGWREADLGVQLHGGAGYMDEYPIRDEYPISR
jgi:alkylation response protein AidB-like acyl-CoA dehydrogenase